MQISSRFFALLLAALSLGQQAAAQDGCTVAPRLVYGQIGVAEHKVHTETVGVRLPLYTFGGGLQLDADLSAAHWSSRPWESGGSRRSTLVLEATPALRWQAGRRWYVSGGVGLTLANRTYRSHGKRFSTVYNFATHLGTGWWLNDARTSALEVRAQHVSNASIKKPNPGENFVQLRYLRQF